MSRLVYKKNGPMPCPRCKSTTATRILPWQRDRNPYRTYGFYICTCGHRWKVK